MMDDTINLPTPIDTGRRRVSTLEHLADIPEEQIWLQKQKSARTRSAYRLDFQHFMRTLSITTPAELRRADHKAVLAWERYNARDRACGGLGDPPAPRALFKHLVRHDHAVRNPVGEVERPAINRDEGSTLAFSKAQARMMLDAPAEDTVTGLRDRAILSVGLQVGLRRAEIAALKVGDLHQNCGYDSLRVSRKGGRRHALAINPQTIARLRAYLEASGHGADVDGPLFRPLKHNGKRQDERRRMDPDAIDRVVRKLCRRTRARSRLLGALDARHLHHDRTGERRPARGRAEAAGHRDPGTTKLYHRRGYNPEKASSFFCDVLRHFNRLHHEHSGSARRLSLQTPSAWVCKNLCPRALVLTPTQAELPPSEV
jgi:integrase/recombinase XerD